MENIEKAKKLDSNFGTQSKDLINQVMNVVMDNTDDDDWKRTSLMQLETSMKHCIQADAAVDEMHKYLVELVSNSNEALDVPYSDYLQKASGKLAEIKNADMEPFYNADGDLQSLRNVISQISCKDDNVTVSDEDDEILTTQQDLNLIDPITKKLMEDPVRHKLCGHVYERTSILQLMKQGRRRGVKCPYMGCAHRGDLNAHDLEVALDYRKEIQRRKRLGSYN